MKKQTNCNVPFPGQWSKAVSKLMYPFFMNIFAVFTVCHTNNYGRRVHTHSNAFESILSFRNSFDRKFRQPAAQSILRYSTEFYLQNTTVQYKKQRTHRFLAIHGIHPVFAVFLRQCLQSILDTRLVLGSQVKTESFVYTV